MTTTKYLQLPIPSKSDRGKIITECLDPAFTKMDQKIESIDSNIDFNLLATLGIPYGGILNNTNAKVAGTAYYDTANKKIYKCTTNTSINYADAGYFIEVSNNDLLGKLQNLDKIRTGTTTATNADGTQLGNTLNFGRPIAAAVACHLGGNPINTNTITESAGSDFNAGLVRFKTQYPGPITVVYIVVLA